jgi:hypothetical protein
LNVGQLFGLSVQKITLSFDSFGHEKLCCSFPAVYLLLTAQSHGEFPPSLSFLQALFSLTAVPVLKNAGFLCGHIGW